MLRGGGVWRSHQLLKFLATKCVIITWATHWTPVYMLKRNAKHVSAHRPMLGVVVPRQLSKTTVRSLLTSTNKELLISLWTRGGLSDNWKTAQWIIWDMLRYRELKTKTKPTISEGVYSPSLNLRELSIRRKILGSESSLGLLELRRVGSDVWNGCWWLGASCGGEKALQWDGLRMY